MMKSVVRRLVNGLMLRRLPGPFVHESGRCWIAYLPAFVHRADSASSPHRSPFILYEDGVALRPAHAAHDDIRGVGFGAYSHWGDCVYFSTSDNSDPNVNGRTYQFSLSPELYRRRVGRFDADGDLTRPIAYRKRDAGPERILDDVDHALIVGRNYLDQICRLAPSPAGQTILEVGPGVNCGSLLYLAAHGARPMAADRFLAPWDAEYHVAFYSALADKVERQNPAADVRPIRAVVEAGEYPETVLRRIEAPLEQIPIASESVDIVLSNAVVEHLYDLRQSFAQLQRITRPGGFGLHQVDHRDHRDFGRPLEFLLMSEKEFQIAFARSHGECGNRRLPDEVAECFRDAGFEVLDFSGNIFADPAYVDAFVPRLRAASRSPFRDRPAEGLRVVSGLYCVRKPAPEVRPCFAIP